MLFTLFTIASLLAACVRVLRVTAACTVNTSGYLTSPTNDSFQIATDKLTVQYANASKVSLDVQFLNCTPSSVVSGVTILHGYISVPAQNACLYVNEYFTHIGKPFAATPVYELQVRTCSLATDDVGYQWIKSSNNYYWNSTTATGATENATVCASGEFGYNRTTTPLIGQNVTMECLGSKGEQPFHI